ncbi:DNA/RNA nuclease SfsA [Haematospirillum sp. H1815]|uniref:DNA/RNA nuclease SfsA n=1 Tax=Haematospirillum sp. H1815 TaxID=2723108 RepID=UPI001438A305|nr:DNA/RNA nuclease SfsA [Haematospirillum sp. H1815]NKD77717.1 DNA/RNA nuclease SfsA [Haematospirillum sp. H1815]
MHFGHTLIRGTLIKRYKRFMADITLADGSVVTAHTANSGSMSGCCTPGSEVWLSPADNPARKLKYTWEMIRVDGSLVGVNTSHPNALAAEAIQAGQIPQLAGYETLRREVKYGRSSRIDILLESTTKPPCYVEVKNVTLFRDTGTGGKTALFPDAVTARGAKHLDELRAMVAAGNRAVMLYVIQREHDGLVRFSIADDIDPHYAAALQQATAAGVEVLCHTCTMTPSAIHLATPLPVAL